MQFLNDTPHTRRTFLRRSGQLALAGSALPFALNLAAIGEAAAFNAPAGDYKALVCVFLGGGNDYGNTVVPYDLINYDRYSAIRGGGAGRTAGGVALAWNALTPTLLAPTVAPVDLAGETRQFALHPSMTGLASLFAAGKMAVQLNVGPLVQPMNRADFDANSSKRPPQLFSHNDQTSLWQSSGPEGTRYGWGGGVGDLAISSGANGAGNSIFTCMSVSGSSVLVSGQSALRYQVNSGGAIAISAIASPYGSATVGAALKTLIQQSSIHKFEAEYSGLTKRAVDAEAAVKAAMNTAPLNGVPTAISGNDLSRQLQTVARLIRGRSSLNSPRRQVFFVSIGGFDMHTGLIAGHVDRLEKVSAAIKLFYDTIASLGGGMENNVTTFTASDFGRTLAFNGDGVDHGWGSHHFVVGGAVNGKAFYGMPPPISVTSAKVGGVYPAPDQWHVGDGRLIPTTSVDQYAGTLAKWFGVADAEMDAIFPNLKNFGVTAHGVTYPKDLGFMQ